MVFYTQEQQVKQKVKQELFDEDTKRSTHKITSAAGVIHTQDHLSRRRQSRRRHLKHRQVVIELREKRRKSRLH